MKHHHILKIACNNVCIVWHHISCDLQIGTFSADYQAVKHKGKKDLIKLLMTFVARNMAGSLVSHKQCRYIVYGD